MRTPFVLLALSSALVLATCAGQVGDIDRTQANKVRKSIFEGEWFYLSTVVDLPYTATFTFVGEQRYERPMERIVWEVSEDFLYARRSYDLVEGTEIGTVPTAGPYRGAVLAAFPIESHFDVIRDYNAATGEPTNVIVENDTDRPWYQREWMRIDWSQNLVDYYDFWATWSELAVDSLTPIPSYLDEAAEDDPDRAIVTKDYVDVVQRMFAEPETIGFDLNDDWLESEEEQDPACWYSYTADCAGAEIRMRHSFLKVGERDFEARHYTDQEVGRFGYFRTERLSYDRRRGITEPGRIYWQQRWDLWGKDHDDRACEDDATCGTESGVRCDASVGRCTLPWTRREVKPIVYHVNLEMPEARMPVVERTFSQWNRSFQRVVNALKYEGKRKLACLPGEEEGGGCCTTADYAAGGDGCVDIALEVRPNTCSFDNVVTFGRTVPGMKEIIDRVSAGPISDLDTLKRVCAALEHATLDEPMPTRRFRWQRPGDLRYSMLYWVDAPNWSNPLGYGPSAADPLTGEIVSAGVYAYGAELEYYATQGVDVVRVLNGELAEDDVTAGVNVRDHVEAMASADRARERRSRERPVDRIRKLGAHVRHPEADRDGHARRRELPRHGKAERQALRERLRGTPYEARLIRDEQRLMLGRSPAELAEAPSAAEIARLSPVGARRTRWTERRRRGLQDAARRNIYLREFADDSVRGLAQSLKGLDEEEAYRQILDAVFAATVEHEVGHTLGLRHNFAGSADPLNFPRQYWDEKGLAPEPFAEYTEEQVAAQMPLYQYSSIMDYGARFHSDLKGLASYDEAAIAYGYGGLDTVFSSLHNRIAGRLTDGMRPGDVLEQFHYTRLPEKFGDSIDAMFDRELVPQGTADGRLVPFKFCSDEYQGMLWDCDWWDRGADAYEIARDAADAYRQYYVFEAFKRERYEFDVWDYSMRMYDRYFLLLTKLFQHWYYFDWDEEWREDPNQGAALTLAAEETLRLFWDVLTTPERGRFCLDEDYGYYTPETWWDECDETEPVPLGAGRPLDVVFDVDSGYYFYDKVLQVGSWYDKTTVMDAMSSPEAAFLGIDVAANADALAFTFFDAWPELMVRLFGGMMAERYDWYGPRAVEREGVLAVEPYDPLEEEGGDAAFAAGTPVYPEIDFTLQTWAAWDAMMMFAFSWDQRFNDAARIYVKGSAEDATPAAGAEEATFEDPFTGRIYAALRYDERFVSPGWQMVTDLAELGERYRAAAEGSSERELTEGLLRYRIDLVDTYRGLYDLFGKST